MWSACYMPTCAMRELCMRGKKTVGRGDTVAAIEPDEDGYCKYYISPMGGTTCIECKEFPKIRTLEGANEFMISSLCEPCFERITGEEE